MEVEATVFEAVEGAIAQAEPLLGRLLLLHPRASLPLKSNFLWLARLRLLTRDEFSSLFLVLVEISMFYYIRISLFLFRLPPPSLKQRPLRDSLFLLLDLAVPGMVSRPPTNIPN